MADTRAIAVCKGGPLDGQCFSVLLDEQGSPLPLTSRAEVVGVTYRPVGPIELTEALHARFYGVLQPEDMPPTDNSGGLYQEDLERHKAAFGHEAAWEYVTEGGDA